LREEKSKFLKSIILIKGENMKFKPWDEDYWNSLNGSVLKYDKLEHFLTSLGVTSALLIILSFFLTAEQSLLYATILNLLAGIGWEIFNGIVPWDRLHIEGFSWKDLLANIFGLILSYAVFGIYLRIF